jgi:hypothetical protein
MADGQPMDLARCPVLNVLTAILEQFRSKLGVTGDVQFDSSFRETSSECLANTRVTLLAMINEWIRKTESDTPHIFWLHGLAGTGKSTIAKTVAATSSREGILGASFFFSRDKADMSTAHLVIPSIAYQLAVFHPPFKFQLTQALQSKLGALDSLSLENQLRDFVVGPLRATTGIGSPLVVVIDALNECSTRQYIPLLITRLIMDLRDMPVAIRIFVTSRSESDIEAAFQPHLYKGLTEPFILHDIETSIVQGDIEQFIRTRLSEVAAQRSDMTWPLDGDVRSLAAKSDGLFIYAATAVKFIARNPFSHRERLKSLLSGSPEKSSKYALLDKLYLEVLNDAFRCSDEEPEEFEELEAVFKWVRTVVGTIVLIWDTLDLRALGTLLRLSHHIIQTTLSHLHSVIAVSHGKEEVAPLIHPSFRDFITSRTRCADDRFLVSAPNHHSDLALACFLSMKRTLIREDICNIGDASKFNADVDDLASRISQYLPVEVQYACRYWAAHLQEAPTILSDDRLVNALNEFTELLLLRWLEVLSLLGHLREAIRSLQRAQTWVSVSGARILERDQV